MEQRRTRCQRMRRIGLVIVPAIIGTLALVFACLANPSDQVFAKTKLKCNVQTYGATGNGTTKDTIAIQNALNACSGGGTVIFPIGTYLTAPLFLQSGLTLDIRSGATILGSQTTSDYIVQPGEVVDTPTLALINADGASNLTITGGGVINGQGAPWWASGASTSKRPRLVEIAKGNNITVKDVTLENAGAMHLFLKETNHVRVEHVTINAPANSPNTDGIDPANAHDVLIKDSVISDGDDNIAIKAQDVLTAYPNAGSSDITIEHCTFGSGHGVSIGNDLEGGVTNVTVKDSVFTNTTNGIRIKATRTTGGLITNITYRNLVMNNVTNPILFTGYYPHIPDTDTPQPVTSTTPNYHDITVEHVAITGGANVGTIVGLPEEPFYNITLKDVVASATTGLVIRNATITVKGHTAFTVSSGPAYILEANGYMNS